MKFTLALIAAASISFLFGSCERHSWEESKVLFEAHGSHGDHGDHGKGGKEGKEKKAD